MTYYNPSVKHLRQPSPRDKNPNHPCTLPQTMCSAFTTVFSIATLLPPQDRNLNHPSNLPQAVCSAFATLLPPPQSSRQEAESPAFGLMVSPVHITEASRKPGGFQQ